jgi:UDP-N-acetylmuramate--alanine ligase
MSGNTLNALQQAAMHRVQGVHFVGIGGAGMSGIAEVVANLGFNVSGSDIKASKVTERLEAQGITVQIGHRAENVTGVSVVVTSSAVGADNPEVVAAHAANVPVIPRAEMLAELMRFRYGIAIAGTHGKTTTTSLTASILAEAGMDPTFVIGGKLNSAGTNARLGDSQYLVAEADESDASFLLLQPMMAVITNIEPDHLSTYGGDFDRLRDSFIEFLHHLPFYGRAVVCVDDDEVRELLPRISRPVLTYGFHETAELQASEFSQDGATCSFVASYNGQSWPITLNMPGRHNVQNALAAMGVAMELGAEATAVQAALAKFEGIGRRFSLRGNLPANNGQALLVDDYGHHPTEVAATLAAARSSWPEKRLVTIFQPHRYSRTQDLFEDFAAVLSETDVLLLCEVFAAGEEPIAGADGRSLAAAIRARGQVNPVFIHDLDALAQVLHGLMEDGDVVLTLGAGSIGAASASLNQQLEALQEA